MTKEQLEAMIARVRALPPEKLADVAAYLDWLEQRGEAPYALSPEERAAVERGLAASRERRFASEERMADLASRPLRG